MSEDCPCDWPKVFPPNRFYMSSGGWRVRGWNLQAGSTVTVLKADGRTVSVQLGKITHHLADGASVAEIRHSEIGSYLATCANEDVDTDHDWPFGPEDFGF